MISPRAYGASAVVGDALYALGGMEYMNQSFQTSKMKVTPCKVTNFINDFNKFVTLVLIQR